MPIISVPPYKVSDVVDPIFQNVTPPDINPSVNTLKSFGGFGAALDPTVNTTLSFGGFGAALDPTVETNTGGSFAGGGTVPVSVNT